MKKIISTFVFLFLFTTVSNSQTLFLENFNYTAGDTLGSTTWTTFSSWVNPIAITSPGLTYAGYPESGIGNKARISSTGQDAYHNFDPQEEGNIYLSFMVNVDSMRANGDYFIAFLPPTSTTNYTSRFYARDSLGLRFGISKSTAAAGGIWYTPDTYDLGTTYLIVIKYTYLPGSNDDEMRFYVFSSGLPSTEPSNPTVGPITGTANDNPLGRVALRQGTASNAPTLDIDGIKVAKTWTDIVTNIVSNPVLVSDFNLSQNYPNPFNPTTKIRFSTPANGFASMKVFNMLGQEVSTLINTNLSVGVHEVEFSGAGIPSGVYFYTVEFSGNDGSVFKDSKKFILSK